ncbi:hypothetical protein [Thermococcus barophilus]|uniref:Uncharacterized protein n=1 Tax=Thermococcus barophilus TaxID=55802 RepID=A0A0S1XFD3_THEBA|nr:hypothetical protein [Thermococcus barophilus]ALM76434.1 conserved exported hypothetical protein [Thermococcus barophilus]
MRKKLLILCFFMLLFTHLAYSLAINNALIGNPTIFNITNASTQLLVVYFPSEDRFELLNLTSFPCRTDVCSNFTMLPIHCSSQGCLFYGCEGCNRPLPGRVYDHYGYLYSNGEFKELLSFRNDGAVSIFWNRDYYLILHPFYCFSMWCNLEHFDSLLWLSTIKNGQAMVKKFGYLTGDFRNASLPLLAQKGYLYFVRNLKNGALAIFNQNFTKAVILIDAIPVLKITSQFPLNNSQLIYDSERVYLIHNKTLYMVKPSKGDYHFPEDFRKVASFSDNFTLIGAYKGRLFLVSNNGTYIYDVENASLSIVVNSKAWMSEFHNGEALLFANSTLYDISDSIVRVGKINLKTFNASEFHKLFYITLDCRKEQFEEGTNVFWSPKGWLIYNGSSLYFFNGTLKKVLDNVSWIRWIGWDGEGFILAGNETILEFNGQKIKNLTPKLREFLGATPPPSTSAQTWSFGDGILILIVLLFLMGIYFINRKGK